MLEMLISLQVSLLTIGYGDFAPKTGAGRTFFVLWSFIAVPTITILASHLTSTVVSAFNAWSHTVADHTILPKNDRWRLLHDRFVEWKASLPWSKARQQNPGIGDRTITMNRTQTIRNEMFAAGLETPDIHAIERQHDVDLESRQPDAAVLARQLALAIRRAAKDMSMEAPRQYSYEEWVEFTRLIRFSAVASPSEVFKEADEGMIEWDWLAENSPMMAEYTEAEFVLERLCESLVRYLRRNPPHEMFAGTLKTKGEDALRLKDGGWTGAIGIEEEVKMKDEQSNLSPEASIPRSIALKTPKSPSELHPLEEEEH
jgi:potassium channel subfamily K, other eukaryote